MTMTNPPRAISPEVARRRMTAPEVNTHTDTGAIPKENQNLLVPSSPEAARRRMTTPVVNTHTDTGAIPKENQNPSCRPLLRRHGAE